MAHDHRAGAHVLQELSGDVAGVSPARQGVTVLPTQQQAPGCGLTCQQGEKRCGRANHYLDPRAKPGSPKRSRTASASASAATDPFIFPIAGN